METNKKIILTGDRPTGKLHLGHYVGSLANRVKLQDEYDCYIIIADYQVLTDHLSDTAKVEKNIREILLDYLAVGIDPEKSTIFIQSAVPKLSELTLYFSFLVSVARLRQNPTVKTESLNAGLDSEKDNITYGFLGYPVSQVADILLFRANLVPAGEDQRPHIELTREIAHRFNNLFGEVFPEPDILLSDASRLPGLDGRKMSKSLGNAINLSDTREEVEMKIAKAVTDPSRIHANDPGHPDICNIFQYYNAFSTPETVDEIRNMCESGKIGCRECKQRFSAIINDFLDPIRERRKKFEQDDDYLREVLHAGNERARMAGEETMRLVRKAMKYDYPNLMK